MFQLSFAENVIGNKRIVVGLQIHDQSQVCDGIGIGCPYFLTLAFCAIEFLIEFGLAKFQVYCLCYSEFLTYQVSHCQLF